MVSMGQPGGDSQRVSGASGRQDLEKDVTGLIAVAQWAEQDQQRTSDRNVETSR
jgi:hypothetical protein